VGMVFFDIQFGEVVRFYLLRVDVLGIETTQKKNMVRKVDRLRSGFRRFIVDIFFDHELFFVQQFFLAFRF
jgi:hypothetical protein